MSTDYICDHCGARSNGQPITQDFDGQSRQFCCQGCQTVAGIIHAGGLDAFYRFRDQPLNRPDTLSAAERDSYALYRDPAIQSQLSHAGERPGSLEIELLIRGITCAACTWLIEQHLKRLPGIEEVWVNGTTHRAMVQWDPETCTLADILLRLRELGYEALPYSPAEAEKHLSETRRTQLFRMGLAGIGAMQNMMLAVPTYFSLKPGEDFFELLRWLGFLITIPVLLYSARPFFDNAFRDIRTRQLTMDVPVALALSLAFGASTWILINGGTHTYFDSVCMFTFFILVSKSIEQSIQHRAVVTLNESAHQAPAFVECLTGELKWKAAAQLQPGDKIRIPAGAAVPADGRALNASQIDEAMMTGEFMPRDVQPGDEVLAGSLVCHTALELEVCRSPDDSQMAVLEHLASRAQSSKSRLVRMADRIASLFVARILLLIAVVGGFWIWYDASRAFEVVLAMLVITCPCALSLSIPAAQSAGLSALRRAGVLVTRPDALEVLPRVRVTAFDKTGTLTLGRFQRTGVRVSPDITEEEALKIAAAMERFSTHPIARAFGDIQLESSLVQGVEVVPARGVSALHEGHIYRIGTPEFALDSTGALPTTENHSLTASQLEVVLGRDGRWLATFTLQDSLRPEAAEVVARLQEHDQMQCALLTGDNSQAARQIGQALGLSPVLTGLSPEEKVNQLQALGKTHGPVMMVGDGLNDAPVMAAADVSVAMNEASDLAKVSADVLLLTPSLMGVIRLTSVARKIRRIARQNIGWAIGYNLVALPFAASGWVTPWIAALGMSVSSLVVVLNASRLARTQE
ncbi:MAG: heavy metal translocating P-type ATPase [Gammaproteobacteria bacterium]|nr:MAG: heavy metal translocating P-type ATPase [Gammaproteobacteria bacterium]